MSYNLPPPPPPELVFNDVYYFGGHSAHPEKHSGLISLTPDWLVFQEMTGLTRNKRGNFRLEIPIQQITQTQVMDHSEISRATSILAGPLWGMGMPVKQKFVAVQYTDLNGRQHTPLFDFAPDFGDKRKADFMSRLYEFTKNNPKPTVTTAAEDPMQMLKLRYAKGEITKEQFEEMKQTLS